MTAISVWPHKVEEPLAVGSERDYLIDWRGDGWLETDENIVDSTWVVEGPAALLSVTYTTGVATAWIAATAAVTVLLTNSITTDSMPLPRKDSRTLVIKLKVR
jgi:hypothetical protein